MVGDLGCPPSRCGARRLRGWLARWPPAAERRRFQDEAEAAATLAHPPIVPILEGGTHGSQRYFSMKLIAGSSLDKKCGEFATDPRAAARLMKQAAEAVHHAHQRGILHR